MSTAKALTTSALGFHEGSTLLRVANTYPTILEVVLEGVQNAVDKDATNIHISVNQRARSITIRDNGSGVTIAEFESALGSVGRTIKKENALGRFGLGMVSPVGKCEKYTFTSTPRANTRSYVEWVFLTADIREQKEVVIPRRNLENYCYGNGKDSRAQKYVTWRTEVRMEKYTTDRFINRLSMESLMESITAKFNAALRRKNVVVKIVIIGEDGQREESEVRGREYEGVPIPAFKVDNTEGGRTTFRLFLAKKGLKGRAGKVSVGEVGNDFRVSFAMFCKNTPDTMRMSEDVQHALLSGAFEGEILSSRARFDANRRGFEANEALMGFCMALDEWYAEQGSVYFKEAQASRQEERFQELGVRSMSVLEELLKSESGAQLKTAIDGFTYGSIGRGHMPKSGKLTDQKYVQTPQGDGEGGAPRGGDGSGSGAPTKEIPAHQPLVTAGPRGQHRKLVKANSLGLSLNHEPLPSNKLYELDVTTGTLTLNVRHPLWVECSERSDRVLMRFQEFLMVQALSMQLVPEDWREYAELALEASVGPYAFTLMYGDHLAGRGPGRRRQDGTTGLPLKSKSLVIAKRK